MILSRPGARPRALTIGGERLGLDGAAVTEAPTAREPILGKTFDVAPASGKVLIKLPSRGTYARDVLATGRGFVLLTEPRQIPAGAEINPRGGELRLVAGSARAGRTYRGGFTFGIFTVTQSARKEPRVGPAERVHGSPGLFL